jgi:hypothetical protein
MSDQKSGTTKGYRYHTIYATILIIGALILLSSHPVMGGQQRFLKKKNKKLYVTKTFLNVDAYGGDKRNWVNHCIINLPKRLNFRWSTKEQGIDSAAWKVTNNKGKVIARGTLTKVPPANKFRYFSLNFPSFIPQKPPKAPFEIKYYVQVLPLNNQAKKFRPSSTVLITYREPGDYETSFTHEDLEGTKDLHAKALLNKAYNTFKSKFGFSDPTGPVKSGKNLPAYQRFNTPNGEAAIEAWSKPRPKIFICVPKVNSGSDEPVAYQWFEYTTTKRGGRIISTTPRYQYPPPDKKQPAMKYSGAWAEYSKYDAAEVILKGMDPPHWTPILIKNDNQIISNIHNRMQSASSQSQAVGMLTYVKNSVENQDLTDRAMENWQPVKLCGIIESANFPDGDLGIDHATDYHDGESVPTGGLLPFEHSDPNWPGMDWDISVNPDPAYQYLRSTARPTVRVEIEHFALGAEIYYWPVKGEWIQAVGRWVTDNGHPENDDFTHGYYTEIHPPELLVSSRLSGAYETEARVIVTGAWQGKLLTFVVNPPPRPSPTAQLKYQILKANGAKGYDRKQRCKLTVNPMGGPSNPNHLLCKVTSTGKGPRILLNSGVVGMSRNRGLRCVIRCWWDETVAEVSGSLKSDKGTVRGAAIFYRDASFKKSKWRWVPTNETGGYRITGLALGKSYWFRPAGSRWSFPMVPRQKVFNKAINTLNFTAAPVSVQKISTAPKGLVQSGRQPSKRVRFSKGRKSNIQLKAPKEVLQSFLLAIEEPDREFGVYRNGMGFPEQGLFFVHLMGLADWNNEPVKDFKSAYSIDHSGGTPSIIINGFTTPGVKGAKIRAKLLIGNKSVGYRTAGEVTTRTNSSGIATFNIKAGTHVEEAILSIEVLENPYNQWFLPKIQGSEYLFFPAKFRGDFVKTPRTRYRLELVPDNKITTALKIGLGTNAKSFKKFMRSHAKRTQQSKRILSLSAKKKIMLKKLKERKKKVRY